MLKIGLNVPVQYHDGWLKRNLRATVGGLEREIKKLKFKVQA